MAISQILYGQYHIRVRPENQKMFKEKQADLFSYGQGTNSAKIVLIVRPEIPQIPQKLSAQFVCPSPKV